MLHRGLILCTLALLVAACGGDSDYGTTPTTTSGGRSSTGAPDWRTANRVIADPEAQALLNSHCATCHTLSPVKKGRSLDRWIMQVQKCMGLRGCLISSSDGQALAHWLYKTYPE